MSNVLCPIVARYSLFFTLALFDSSILARSKYPREVALSMVQHAQEQSQAHRHAKTAAATKVTILNQPKDRDKTLFSAFFFWFFLFSVPLSFSLYSLLSLSLSRVFALQIILWFFSALTRNLVWNKERNRASKKREEGSLPSPSFRNQHIRSSCRSKNQYLDTNHACVSLLFADFFFSHPLLPASLPL